MKCLALDAMGVIFASAEDVGDLLIPFIVEQSGTGNEEVIQTAYLAASLGQISPDEFWIRVGVSPELEDTYLALHNLNPGVMELLTLAKSIGVPVWCLSNDVGRWSRKLRENLGIEQFLSGSVISGDVLTRKPDAKIYQILIDSCGFSAEDILFVDDREANVHAAQATGLEAVKFSPEFGFAEISKGISQCPG